MGPSAGFALATRLALRELRGGLAGFRIFIACLILGVAAIAAVQSVSSGVLTGLREDGRTILGGDLAVQSRFTAPTAAEAEFLGDIADAMAVTAQMRAMTRNPDDGETALGDLKAVDGAYPLFGAMVLEGADNLAAALESRNGTHGAAVDPSLADRLGLEVGDRITVGDAVFDLRALILAEPDRGSGAGITFGPRVMIAQSALDPTGLMREGSMIDHIYLLRIDDARTVEQVREEIEAGAPEAQWRIRDYTRASPQLERIVERLTLFLTLVGLTALLVGGVGVSNAVKSFLDGRVATIATFKCLGAPSRLIFQIYLTQILILATGATAVGLIIGAAAPPLILSVLSDLLPFEARTGIYAGPLVFAAAFGLLTALTFSLWPLARARDVSAAALFRDAASGIVGGGRPGLIFLAAVGICAAALAVLAIVTARDTEFAAWFVGGAIATIFAFRLAAQGILALTRRMGRPNSPSLRLALANLHRPGAPTVNVVLSLGLGLTVLVAVVLIEGNLTRQVEDELPDRAPSFFFVDIQPDQREGFIELVSGFDAVEGLEEVPSLRGRIITVNGVPAEEALIDEGRRWLLRGDRGVTYSTSQRPGDDLVAGEWWDEAYDGPPLLSIYSDIAEAFGLAPGDRMGVRVMGREIEAEIANIREIDWGTLGINFTLVFSPEPLRNAPHTYIATARAGPDQERALQRAVAENFSTITTVSIRDALETVNQLLQRVATAVRSTAAITILAGTLVLAGAVAAGHRRRVYESVILKVLGATRGTVLRAYCLEYGLLGLITTAIAVGIGTLTAWLVVTEVMELSWTFIPWSVALTAVLCSVITIGFGFVGTWRALGQKAAPLLRNE